MSNPQQSSHYPSWHLPVAGPELHESPEHACSYLPEKLARFRAFEAGQLSPGTYQELMDAGFRRSGRMVYQPMCSGCRACVPLRVNVEAFEVTKSFRRALKKNSDITVRIGQPKPSAEKWLLYESYQRQWHSKEDAGAENPLHFVEFLYDSPVETAEFEYRNRQGKLLGVGICDLCEKSLSSVYFYFDPAERVRSLGTFSAVYEILWAREMKIPYWYAGYWIEGCGAMAYKSRFRPAELLGTDGQWRSIDS
jgi:leucyl-tRNA---protein transferase